MMTKFRMILLVLLVASISCNDLNTINFYDSALTDAKQSKKNVLLDFGATWCGGCIAFEKYVFDIKDIKEKLSEKFVVLKIDRDEPKNRFLVEKYKISELPHIVIINNEEKILGGVLGFDEKYVDKPEVFISKLNEIIESQNTIVKLEDSISVDSSNTNLLNSLLKEYKATGQYFGVEKIKQLLVKLNPTPERVFEYNFGLAVKMLKSEKNPDLLVKILNRGDSLDIKHKALALAELLSYYKLSDDIQKQDLVYNKLLEINPDYYKMKYARFLFEHNMKIDSAIVITEELLLIENIRNDHWGQFLKAHSHVYQGEKQKAINEYNTWMKENIYRWESEEDYWPLNFYARFANYHDVELKSALDYIKIAVEKRNLVDDKILMGKILYKLGDCKLAVDKLTESLKYINNEIEYQKIGALIEKYKKEL